MIDALPGGRPLLRRPSRSSWRGRQLRRYERAPIHARGPIARAQPNPTDSMAIAAVTVAVMNHRRTRSWPGFTATSGFIATSVG